MADGAKSTIAAGMIAVAGAIGGAAITGWSQVQLAEQKFNSDLVLKALESGDASQRLESLRLLIETNLLKDPQIQEGVRTYAKARATTPETIPQIITSTVTPSLAAPVVKNARVFLLAGLEGKRPLFETYRRELEAAGFRVLDSKIISDEGRPNTPEIRYFYSQDSAQAEALAEFVRFKLSDKSVQARMYPDPRVKTGYIEVWFGK